jgi:hypothetical protein
MPRSPAASDRNLQMSRNIGNGEGTLRLIIGVALAALAVLADLQFGWAVLVFLAAMALLVTSLLRYCPINAALGRDSTRDASMLR